MAEYVTTYPTAHKRHRCSVCGWDVMPGEQYSKQVVFDCGSARTWKTCLWCERVCGAYCRASGCDEYDQGVLEWLEDSHPTVWGQMRAGWRYPDGERVPLPLQPRCVTCGGLLDFWGLWCGPCDRARIARLNEQLLGLRLTAGHYSECAGCGATVAPGDPIRHDDQDGWVHRVCPQPPARPVCPTCWLTHPTGACDRD